jgi:hypothetical protein
MFSNEIPDAAFYYSLLPEAVTVCLQNQFNGGDYI